MSAISVVKRRLNEARVGAALPTVNSQSTAVANVAQQAYECQMESVAYRAKFFGFLSGAIVGVILGVGGYYVWDLEFQKSKLHKRMLSL